MPVFKLLSVKKCDVIDAGLAIEAVVDGAGRLSRFMYIVSSSLLRAFLFVLLSALCLM